MTESVSCYNTIVDINMECKNKMQKYHTAHDVSDYLFCSRGKRELFKIFGVRKMYSSLCLATSHFTCV